MGDLLLLVRLMVGLRFLVPSIRVRVPDQQLARARLLRTRCVKILTFLKYVYNMSMNNKTGFNISRIKGSGVLILPISMSRISGGQTPEDCYEMLSYFEDKIETFSNDAIIMYTNGLYFNTEDSAFEKRVKTNMQVLSHVTKLDSLIQKGRKFIPKAIHFMPIDYVIMNSPSYQHMFSKLKKLEKEDSEFRKFLEIDLDGRKYTEANINFFIEEIIVTHLITEQFVDLPVTLARADEWRLICYPGKTTLSQVYVCQKNILEKNQYSKNEYRGCMYNFKDKVLEVFSDIDLSKI